MATNPLVRAWNYLNTPLGQPAPTPALPQEEQKTVVYVFGTDTPYPNSVGQTLSAAFGGPTADGNSAVYACLSLICTSFQEAPLRVFRKTGEEERWDDRHPMQALIDDPHPDLTPSEINWWLEYAKHVHGNAYLRKIRAGAGNVLQLWPVSPTKVAPHTTDEDRARGVFVSFYRIDHEGDGKRFEDVPPEDILHFRMGLDDRDHRLGCSPLRYLLREIGTDNATNEFSEALLRNYAVPGLVVQLPPNGMATEDQARVIRDRLQADYGGGGRGRVAVLNNGATAQPLGFNPQQMDLKSLHLIPESRIAAVFGTPAMVVGLQTGLDRSTFSNYEEAREALFEQTVVPLYRADAATWQKHLLRRDFDRDPAVRVKYDLTDVRALQPDMNEVYERLSIALGGKAFLKRNEARSEVGLPPVDGWDEEDEQSALDAAEAMAELGGGPQALLEAGDEDGEEEPQSGGAGQRVNGRSRALPARKALNVRAFPALFDTMVALAEPGLRRDLQDYLRGQEGRVLRRAKRLGG